MSEMAANRKLPTWLPSFRSAPGAAIRQTNSDRWYRPTAPLVGYAPARAQGRTAERAHWLNPGTPSYRLSAEWANCAGGPCATGTGVGLGQWCERAERCCPLAVHTDQSVDHIARPGQD